jgi:hypothetical protein
VGTWDVEYRDITKDGREQHRTGQFIMAWVLDGRAIEDVWIVDPSEGRPEREVYAAIQYFDSKSHSWPAPEPLVIQRHLSGQLRVSRRILERRRARLGSCCRRTT